jgi:hypothetical protein
MRLHLVRVLVLAVVSLGLTACGGGGGGGHKPPPGPASITIVSGNSQTGVAGLVLPDALTVRVADSGARPVAGVTVSWAVTAGGGTVTPASSVTDSGGAANTRWTLGTTAGANRVTATVAGISGVMFEATATAAVTASVTVSSPTLSPYEGDSVQLTAIAKDAAGNGLPGKTAIWVSSRPDTAPVSPTGLLQTWGTGPVVVTASVDGVKGSVTLTLTPILVTVTVGAKQVVFYWSSDRCEKFDTPDNTPRVVRAEDGSLVLFSGNAPRYYVSRGADFASLRRDCSQPVLVSADVRTPESYENWEWPWVVYREGPTWHMLISNEFHDTFASACTPGDPSPANPCWYNSITYAVSTDGARSFSKPLAPAHVVGPPPRVWMPPAPGEQPNWGRYYLDGYLAPSNIVHTTDGYYQALMALIPSRTETYRVCAIRTPSLDDPSNWRAWDGQGFNLRMSSPYVTEPPQARCAAIARGGGNSITFNTHLNRYVAVTNSGPPGTGNPSCGFYFLLSADLIHWSQSQLIAEARINDCDLDPAKPGLLETVPVIFPALVDHADLTANFERSGQTPYLYYVRFNKGITDPESIIDRDVVRVPLTFTREN